MNATNQATSSPQHPPMAGTDDEKWQQAIDLLVRLYPDCGPALRTVPIIKRCFDEGHSPPLFPKDLRSDETIFAEVDQVATATIYRARPVREILRAARARVAELRHQAAERERQLFAAERAFLRGWPDEISIDRDETD